MFDIAWEVAEKAAGLFIFLDCSRCVGDGNVLPFLHIFLFALKVELPTPLSALHPIGLKSGGYKMFCSQCGNNLSEIQGNFCQICGTKKNNPTGTVQPSPLQINAAAVIVGILLMLAGIIGIVLVISYNNQPFNTLTL